MSLRVGFLCKASCGIRGRLVGPGATNRAEAVCTAWLIIGWKVYRCYTRDGRGGKVRQRERLSGREGRLKKTRR